MVEDSASPDAQPADQAGAEEQVRDDAAVSTAAEPTSTVTTAQSTPEDKVASSPSRPATSSSAVRQPSPSSKDTGAGAQQRSTSAKFASLRAAFEKSGSPANGSPEEMGRKRLASSGESSVGKARERNQEHEAEVARLRDELEKERELRTAYEERVGILEGEMNGAKEKMSKQADELAVAAQKVNELEQLRDARAEDSAGDDNDGVAEYEHQDTATLRRQLSELKRNISRSTRATGQMTDSALRQEIGLLQHEVQNWVVNNFRKVKVQATPASLCEKLTRIAEPKQFEQLRPLYEMFDPAAKLAIYQATVAVYLMEIFSDTFLFGLRGQQEWSKRTRQAAETLPAALDSLAYNRWRAATFFALTESVTVKESVDTAAAGMAEMICITLNAMTESEESDTRMASLRTIVKRAVLLAHQIRAQQAQYIFTLPAPGHSFEATSMDDIIDDSDADGARTVNCATFPSLFKGVDDDGSRLEPQKVVFRAKVLCYEEVAG